MSSIKKIASALVFFVLMGTTTAFAQKKEQKVSNDELTKFASVFDQLEQVNMSAQQKMVKVVEGTGLEMKRFNEIHVAYINPNIKGDATPEEMKMHDKAMKQIEKMQEELQSEMDGIVKKSGMTTKKYQRIATDMQDNMELRERYKKLAKAKKEE